MSREELELLKAWVIEVARRNQAWAWSKLMTRTIELVRQHEPDFWK